MRLSHLNRASPKKEKYRTTNTAVVSAGLDGMHHTALIRNQSREDET
jgi:hypothetical protein